MEIEKKFATLDKYMLLKTLGSGYHAKVKLAYSNEDSKHYAIKVFKPTHSFQSNLKALENEIKIMKRLKHHNLVNLIDFKESIDYVKKNGKTYKVMAIVLELAQGGELFEYVATTGRFSEEIAKTYFH
jgi:serine/threonine protein kinase